ncbi:MAG: hypothetical protein K5867_11095 [Bacteroidales bacterium]|nr:hypothetical protein [Bacteroidales bacterium]
MFTFIVCLVFVALIAIKVKKAVKKAFPMPNAPAGMNDADGFDFVSDDEKNAGKSEEYFSYEKVGGDTCFTEQSDSTRAKRQKTSAATETDDKASSVDFDLRQAVIYNTILNNDYIGERI